MGMAKWKSCTAATLLEIAGESKSAVEELRRAGLLIEKAVCKARSLFDGSSAHRLRCSGETSLNSDPDEVCDSDVSGMWFLS